MSLLGLALACVCSSAVGGSVSQSDEVCHRKRQNIPTVAAAAPVLLQTQGVLHTLRDPSSVGAGDGLYLVDSSAAAAIGVDAQADLSVRDLAGAVTDVLHSSEFKVSAVTESGGGVEVLEGSSVFARELPERMENSFGEAVDEGTASIVETPGLWSAEASSAAEMESAADNPKGTIIDIPLNSELQVSAAIDIDSSVVEVSNGGSIHTKVLPQDTAVSTEAVADLPADQAHGIVIDIPLNSELEVSATTVDANSGAYSHTNGQSPNSEESESPSDSDLAEDSTNTIDGTQDRDPTGDRGDQAARDDNDLAEDSTDGIPGEGINHPEGGHVDPAAWAGHKMKVDRQRYAEDWAAEWKPDQRNTAAAWKPDQRNSSQQQFGPMEARAEAVKNSLAILGRRPQVAATVVVVAAFVATRR